MEIELGMKFLSETGEVRTVVKIRVNSDILTSGISGWEPYPGMGHLAEIGIGNKGWWIPRQDFIGRNSKFGKLTLLRNRKISLKPV